MPFSSRMHPRAGIVAACTASYVGIALAATMATPATRVAVACLLGALPLAAVLWGWRAGAPPWSTKTASDALARLLAAQALGQMGDWLLDPDTGVAELSPQACRMYDLDPAQPRVAANALIALYAPAQQALIASRLETALRTGEPQRYELQRIDASGEPHDESVVAVREDGPDGRPRIRGIVQDVSARRRAERSLAREQERLALTIAAADIGLWQWVVGADRVHYSSVWKAQLGYADDEVGDGFDEWRQRVHPDDVEGAIGRLDAYLAAPHGLYRSEFRMRHRDGGWRWILATASMQPGEGGEPATLLGAHVDITDLRRGAEAIAASEARLRRVVDGLGGHMYVALLSPDGTIEWVNSSATAMTGAAEAEFVGRPLAQAPVWRDMPDERARAAAHVEAAATGRTVRWDLQVRAADGSVRWVEATLQPVLDADGAVDRIVASGVDIDERKRAEAAVAGSEARLRRVLDGLGPRIFVGLCDARGTLTWVNRVSLEIAALEESDVVGLHFADTYWWCHDAEVAARLRAAMARALSGDVVRYDEMVRIGGDDRLWVDFCVQPLRNTDGAIAGLVVSAFDIAERRAAQLLLAEREQLLRRVIDNAVDPLFLLDVVDGGYRQVASNPAFDRLFPLVAATAGPPLQGLAGAHARLARGEATAKWHEDIQTPEGHREFDAYLTSLPVAGGEQLIGSLHDVTAEREGARQRQRLSQRLVELQESEQRRLSAELHDRIGQALTGLGLNLEIISAAATPASARATRLQDSRELLAGTIAAVRNLVSELRPPALVDYGVLAALRTLAIDVAARGGVEVHVAGDEPTPRLSPAAETALYRIAQEALSNALKHAGARHIAIELMPENGRTRLEIRDDGRGFAPASTGAAGGHWGLALMQERAAAVGGRVRVESAPGAGTCVRVTMDGAP